MHIIVHTDIFSCSTGIPALWDVFFFYLELHTFVVIPGVAYCTMCLSKKKSGKQQLQNTSFSAVSSVECSMVSLGKVSSSSCVYWGNGDNFPALRQLYRCSRILHCLKKALVGSCPLHNSVALAMANNSQPLLPFCC